MQAGEHLCVAAEDTGLTVRHPVLPAEAAHEGPGPTQVWPWHAREQVMLDLIVQATEQKIHDVTGAHVAGRQDLPAGKVVPVALGENRHRDVVRGEDEAQVHPHRDVMDDREEQRAPRAERRGQDAGVGHEVRDQDGRLRTPMPCFATENDRDALVPQVESFEQEHRQEQRRLMPDDPAPHGRDVESLRFREREHARGHVGIVADAVGMVVVAAMLAEPPAEAQAHDAVKEREREHPVGAWRPEDLVVRGVVSEKADLTEGEGQEDCDARLDRRSRRERDQVQVRPRDRSSR